MGRKAGSLRERKGLESLGKPCEAPRIRISNDLEVSLLPPGKRCAAMGTVHLPGSMQRSQTAPNLVMTSPIGWSAESQRSAASKSREFQD